ncbi:MAG TPA: hypothetical protein VFV87_21290, partial [Pirellulaceae bacterium]|nr:hypothetical protein [Pirellulaceae bacterium]
MEARFLRAAALAAVSTLVFSVCSSTSQAQFARQHSSVRSEHFIVSAPSRELAEEICQAAEKYRKDLAIEWLGKELGPWREPCPIQAHVHPQLGAGGVTSFMFDRGQPWGWTMTIQGSRERILDSVLPHEVTHTIFATHFGRPLPRWADEGACTTVESPVEKSKQDKFLIQFLTTDRGIPFNQMFAMKEYPADILPLYSQGYSLARYLIHQGGKRKFVDYVGEGMQTNNWTATTKKHYGFTSLSDLQVTWVEWVRQGSPDISALASAAVADVPTGETPTRSVSEGVTAIPTRSASEGFSPSNLPGQIADTQMASMTRIRSAGAGPRQTKPWQSVGAQRERSIATAQHFEPPPQPSSFPAESYVTNPQYSSDHSSVSRPVSEGWYAKRRDQAQAVLHTSPEAPTPTGGTIPAPPTRASASEALTSAAAFSPSPP